MNTTIYYFTATGNSLFVARKLSEKFENSSLKSMVSENKNAEVVCETENIGFVFPLYFSGIPLIVEDFIKKLAIKNAKYIFTLVTCGVPITGAALYNVKKILKRKNLKLNLGMYIQMVDNYLPIYDVPPVEKQSLLNSKALMKIEKISEIIKTNKNKLTNEITLFSPLFYKPWRKNVKSLDNKFFVDDTCNRCGICEKVCPVNNIKLSSRKPQWLHNCEFCFACIHHCPKKAIQIDSKSSSKSRYIHPEIKLKDIMPITDGK